MTPTEISIVTLLIIVAAQTSYLTYQSRRQPKSSKKAQILVDTSVLMDGRILPIALAGFIPGVLVIPRSVVGELQLLADGGDSERRERARRGLDVINELQAIERIEVRILQDGSRAEEGVDERLLKLAKRYNGILCTIDFNLNKVALVENIPVLNINELAQKLRMSYLPGDRLQITLTQAGSDSHQAVGHLDDGTMVVVEHAKAQIGKSAEIEIIRSLQTAAGRMMFAKLVGATKPQASANPKKPHNESRGRRKVAPAAVAVDAKPQPVAEAVQQQKPSVPRPPEVQRSAPRPARSQQPSQKPQQQQRPKSSRQDREDALIALVNKQ